MAIGDINVLNGVGDGGTDGSNTFGGGTGQGSILFGDSAPTDVFQSELEGLSGSRTIVIEAKGDIKTASDLSSIRFPSFGGGGGDITFNARGAFLGGITSIIGLGRQLKIIGAGITTGNLSVNVVTQVGPLSGGKIELSSSANLTALDLNASSKADSGLSGRGGDIFLSATGGMNLGFLNSFSFAVGSNAIEAGQIVLNAGGDIKTLGITSDSSSTSSNAGHGGLVQIAAVGGITTTLINSSSKVNNGNAGSAGGITLTSTNGGISTFGFDASSRAKFSGNSENGGAISISANTTFGVINNNDQQISSFSQSDSSGSAVNGGAISLVAGAVVIGTKDINSFSSRDGSGIGSAGNGGAVRVSTTSNDANINNINAYSLSNSGGSGNGGSIAISSNGFTNTKALSSFSQSNGANAGNGGNISLDAPADIITSLALVSNSLVIGNGNTGNGGNISITAFGEPEGRGFKGAIAAQRSLDSRSLVTGNGNAGNGGNISLNANDNVTVVNLESSSSTGLGNTGDGGAIAIASGKSISANAINSDTFVGIRGGAGNGGSILLSAKANITVASLKSRSFDTITAILGDIGKNFSKNGGAVELNSGGDTNVGTIDSSSKSIASGTQSGSNVFSVGTTGDGGNISLTALGKITATSDLNSGSTAIGSPSRAGDQVIISAGNGGAISLKASQNISVANLDSSSSGLGLDNDTGVGGAISISSDQNILTKALISRSFVANTGRAQNGGKIVLNALGNITTTTLDSRSFVSNSGSSKDGGAIAISSGANISLNATDSSSTSGARPFGANAAAGSGGTVDIRAVGTINLNNQNISAFALANNGDGAGSGGAVTLSARIINLGTGTIDSSSSRTGTRTDNIGDGGAISLEALTDGGLSTNIIKSASQNARGNSGNGGAVNITSAGNATLGLIDASTLTNEGSARNGGLVNINASKTINFNNQNIFTSARSNSSGSSGSGGVVTLGAAAINFGEGSISSSTSSSGNSGDGGAVSLNVLTDVDGLRIRNINSTSQSSGGNSGNGGAIAINSKGIVATADLNSSSSSVNNSGNGGAIAIDTIFINAANFNSSSLATGINRTSTIEFGNPVGIPPGNALSGNGGAISLSSTGAINTLNLNSSSLAIAGIDINGGFVAGTASAGNGGKISLTSALDIRTGIINSSSQVSPVINTQDPTASSTVVGNSGDGGAVNINTLGAVTIASLSSSTSAVVGNAGNGGAIAINTGNFTTGSINTSSSIDFGTAGKGGDIDINGANISITQGISTLSNLFGGGTVGKGGNVNLTATGDLNVQSINNFGFGTFGFGDITLTGNEINLNGGISSVVGIGKNLVLKPSDSSRNIVIGGTTDSSSSLDFTNSDISAIASGFNKITFGNSNSSGDIKLRSNSFNAPVIFRSPNGKIDIESVPINGNLEFDAKSVNIAKNLSLTLGKNEEIVNTGNLSLTGSTFNLNGFNETANQLIVSSSLMPSESFPLVENSVINFGNGSSKLSFASSSSQTWTGTLNINNWSPTSGEALRFGTDASGLTAFQLSQIQFTGFGFGAQITSSGLVIPVGVGIIGNGIINGTSNPDLIYGGTGRDRLSGGAGNDVLNGGLGADILIGGAGADIFQYNGLTDSLVGAPDRIADFNQIQGDRFQLLSGNPTGLITDAGTISASNLIDASSTAFNGLGSGQAVFFGFNNRSYLGVNDNNSSFNSGSDLLVEVSGITRGTNLNASSYFV